MHKRRNGMIVFPGSKINLGLRITKKRQDGYHNLQTVFYPLSFSDVLEAIPDKGTSLTTSGLQIPGSGESNLAMQAIDLMGQRYHIPGFRVHLHKVIPPGSGLGGGSADAAAMIKMINQLAKLNLSENAMIAIASDLGADCAFFIKNTPVYATARGDRFETIDFFLKGYTIVVILPGVSISTAQAYRQITPAFPQQPVKEAVQMPLGKWKEHLINDFEKIKDLPAEIFEIKTRLYKEGAVYAAMSGSGSAVFGVFDTNVEIGKEKFSPYQVHVEKAEH
ncbi:MAG: 4-(cytidine 5'-diphospho)-2-C-methyl-D-erythritol kinase [Bacteroidales bacterium]|nr:4-(cytidine 5'-diphospho)-2-C-methyl-D-erythritol kinase [Bacteroidales bacterium]MCF8334069.1 4-(cytidine 5'-diphospho)-2-C-methyl-D-erythritol kinase [Bacteroidales bacterium]